MPKKLKGTPPSKDGKQKGHPAENARFSSALPPLGEYDHEVVASIAAKLLKGDDFTSATKAAFQLLDSVSSEAACRRAKDKLENPHELLLLRDVVCKITDLTDREYAMERYREFLAFLIAVAFGSGWPLLPEEKDYVCELVEAEFEDQKTRGLPLIKIEFLTVLFHKVKKSWQKST